MTRANFLQSITGFSAVGLASANTKEEVKPDAGQSGKDSLTIKIAVMSEADIEAIVERAIRKVAADNTGSAYIERIPNDFRTSGKHLGDPSLETCRFFIGAGDNQRREISRQEAHELWPKMVDATIVDQWNRLPHQTGQV
jgi:hypothetical protein